MDMIRGLNVPIHVTPVGLVACLPPTDNYYEKFVVGDVLGVVTKCERCDGRGWDLVRPIPGVAEADVACPDCDGTGCAPLRFVKVLAVWPIEDGDQVSPPDYISVGGDATYLIRSVKSDIPGFTEHWAEGPLDLPDAEPGGVALHVEWIDCPTCGGDGINHGLYFGDDRLCPTCQTPPTVEGDGPIVEVTT